MKAIVSTSANPFHYGHLDIYQKAKRIFSEVKVVVAQNNNKEKTTDLNFHMNAYNIPYEIINNQMIADYCRENNIRHIVRGIRNGVDAEYELKLDFANKEINNQIQTIFIPTDDTFSNLSSSNIREFLKYNKYDIVKKYMDEDAMYRYINSNKYVCYFGKSCIGKSTYLEHLNIINVDNYNICNVDEFIWYVYNKRFGLTTYEKAKDQAKKFVFEKQDKQGFKNILNDTLDKEYWDIFFDELNKRNEYILDWASVGFYYNIIPIQYRSQIKFIELTTSNENRKRNIQLKGFEKKIKILDDFYEKPLIVDEVVDIE